MLSEKMGGRVISLSSRWPEGPVRSGLFLSNFLHKILLPHLLAFTAIPRAGCIGSVCIKADGGRDERSYFPRRLSSPADRT